MANHKKSENVEITVLAISQGTVKVGIVGQQPLIYNRLAAKAQRELLLPKLKMNAAERAANLKHDPIEEYRNSVHRNVGDDHPTRLRMPSPAFKGAMMTAALDLPGTAKSVIGRLSWVEGYSIDLYGIPQLFMCPVRMADIGKTSDIRTRAIVPEWCCVFTVSFVRPRLTESAVFNLIAAGGITCGVGDFRQEKGKGSFGQYRLTETDDPELNRIIKTGGRQAQDAALQEPVCFDGESQELLEWYTQEILKRQDRRPIPQKPASKRQRKILDDAAIVN